MIALRHLFNSFMIFLVCNATYGQGTIPFRDASTYSFELDYNFKTRPTPPNDYVSLDQPQTPTGVLPYVKVKFVLFKVLEDDYRVKIVNNHGNTVFNKRIKEPMEVKIDLGFTEDLKDKTSPYLFYVYYLNKETHILAQIKLEVEESGNLLLNNEIYGKL